MLVGGRENPPLLELSLVEPALIERESYAESEVVLLERSLLERAGIEIWDVCLHPLHRDVDTWLLAPDVSVSYGESDACRDAELIGLV